MPDPGWAARTPEANDTLLKAGTGVGTHVANQAAWQTLGATHHASGVASAINTSATSASWLGGGSAASASSVTSLNASLHGLAGWVDVKPAGWRLRSRHLRRPVPACAPPPSASGTAPMRSGLHRQSERAVDVDAANYLAGNGVLRVASAGPNIPDVRHPALARCPVDGG